MHLISSTRSLSPPRPITDPILNCHHIQPAAAGASAAAVGPWLYQFHTPPSPNSLTSPYSSAYHLDQLSTTSTSAPTPTELSLQAPPLPPLTPHSPSSASSSSPSTLPQSSSLTATASSSYHPSVVLRAGPASATMHPNANTNSDDDGNTPEDEQSLSTTPINPPHHSLALCDLPPSSVPPITRSQPSAFPSHPDHEHHHQNQQQHHHHQQHHHQQQRPQHPQQHHPYLHSPPLPSPSHHSSQVQHAFDPRHHPNSFLGHHSYHSRPQSAPHPAMRNGLDPHVMAAASKVEVKRWDEERVIYFQVAHDGHTVGRVRETGMVNGTKLLNLAGISRGKRDGILKNEKMRKVVKHGTMHLKGVWISFERAQALAEQYAINQKVFPLLVTNLQDYLNIDPAIMAGGPKPAVHSMMQHHHSRPHPHAQQQPAKFSHLGITIPPSSAGPHGYSSATGWPASSSSAATIGYNEPFSAPAVAQNAPGSVGSPSMYAQAQAEFLKSAGFGNSNLSERRQTLAGNNYNGYHSVASFGSPHTTVSYSSPYSTVQFAGYPSRAGPSETPSPSQFEYPLRSHPSGSFSSSSGSGAAYQASLYQPQLGSAPPTACLAVTKPSPALHPAQLVGTASPATSPVILLGPSGGTFRRGDRPAGPGSSGGVKREVGEGGADDAQLRRVHARMHEESSNESSGSFRGSVSESKPASGPLGDWNTSQAGIMTASAGGITTANQGEEAHSGSTAGRSPTAGSGQANGSSASSNDGSQQLWQQQTQLQEAGYRVANQHVGGAHPELSSHHQWQS